MKKLKDQNDQVDRQVSQTNENKAIAREVLPFGLCDEISEAEKYVTNAHESPLIEYFDAVQ